MAEKDARERGAWEQQPWWVPSTDWPHLDSGLLLRVYAWLAWITGGAYFGWGPMWTGFDLPGLPYHKAALVRVFGAILFGAGCAAHGVARVEDPLARRRALRWLVAGHFAVALAVSLQNLAIFDQPTMSAPILIPWVATILLVDFYWFSGHNRRPWMELERWLDGRSAPREGVRSAYEQQVRAAGAQEERNRLARDLHDSIKQQIFVMQTAAATAEARFGTDPEGVRDAIALVRNSAREAMTEMQAMLDQLRATPLENASLVEALKAQCEALGFRTGAKVRFELGSLPPNEALPPGAHEALLRAAQEALANVGRHARAKNVDVRLGIVRRKLALLIRDDGSGFDTNHNRRGMGIDNMRARALEFGGQLELISAPGRGASVTLSIPYTLPTSAKELRHEALGALISGLIALAYSLLHPHPWIIAFGVFLATDSVISGRAWLHARKANRHE